MAALSARDAERALRFVSAAEDLGGEEAFPPAVLRELGRLVPADWIGYGERDVVQKRCLLAHDHPSFEEVFGAFDHAAANGAGNPLCYYQAQGHFEAISVSQLVPRNVLRRTAYYRVVLEPLGISDQLGVAIPSDPSHAKRFFFDRTTRNFSARDRLVLDLLQPHFDRLWRVARTRRRLRAALAALEREDEHEARGVIVLAPVGELEVVSPAARRLVRDYFGMSCETELPPALREWLESGATTLRRRRLTVERSGELLLLEEAPSGLGLTAREREIMTWVARGKTNPEVAELLWIAPTTVRKHLENVYAKLGVRTRTAAAARFLREERGS